MALADLVAQWKDPNAVINGVPLVTYADRTIAAMCAEELEKALAPLDLTRLTVKRKWITKGFRGIDAVMLEAGAFATAQGERLITINVDSTYGVIVWYWGDAE